MAYHYRVIAINETTGQTEVSYTIADTHGKAMEKVLRAVEDRTPLKELPTTWTVTASVVSKGAYEAKPKKAKTLVAAKPAEKWVIPTYGHTL